MPSALIDTCVMQDYLNGEERAQAAIEPYAHRSISVVTWLELMAACPAGLHEPTRSFLRGFERLSVSESIADEALRLMHERAGLALPRALTWASANVNQLRFVTANPAHVSKGDHNVVLAYRRKAAAS